MACRVGITTDPQGRQAYWRSRCRNLRNWQILQRYSSKQEAQQRETYEARQRGCEAHPGGDGPEWATWYVYYFQHDGCI